MSIFQEGYAAALFEAHPGLAERLYPSDSVPMEPIRKKSFTQTVEEKRALRSRRKLFKKFKRAGLLTREQIDLCNKAYY